MQKNMTKLISTLLCAAFLTSCASPYMDAIMRMPDGPAKVAALQAAQADQERRTAQVQAGLAAAAVGLAAGAAAAAASRPTVIYQPVPVYNPYYPYWHY